MNTNRKLDARRMARIALMAACVAVGAQITIPMPAIPFTLQTFFLVLTGTLLGPLDACITLVVYLLLGAVGVPVFTGFTAGVQKFVGGTGGYLLSYPAVAAMCGCFYKNEKVYLNVLMSVLGIIVCELAGMVGMKFLLDVPWPTAWAYGFGIFIIKDIICAVAASLLGRTMRKRLKGILK